MTTAERVQRLLAILQWAASRSEGVTIEHLCDRFDLGPDELVRELGMASMIGADSPHYDEMPFEVIVEDERVWVRLFSFDRPMRLTPAEGLALVAAADALVGDEPDPDSPLWRALVKLADLFGIEPGTAVDVDLDPEGGPTGRLLGEAIVAVRRVRFTYWSYGRDVVSERLVDPWRVVGSNGAWYLIGHDVDREAERRFRVDRIEGLVITDEVARRAPKGLDTSVGIGDDEPIVVLDLPPDARWVAEAYPVIDAVNGPDGRLRVTLAIAGTSWLERLLLRLGPSAEVVEADPSLGDGSLLATAAARVLARYRGGTPKASR